MACTPPYARGTGCCKCCPPPACLSVVVTYDVIKTDCSSSSSSSSSSAAGGVPCGDCVVPEALLFTTTACDCVTGVPIPLTYALSGPDGEAWYSEGISCGGNTLTFAVFCSGGNVLQVVGRCNGTFFGQAGTLTVDQCEPFSATVTSASSETDACCGGSLLGATLTAA